MRNRLKRVGATLIHAWRRVQYPVGYSVFAIAISYGLWRAPAEVWQLRPFWLLSGIGTVLLMFFLQQWQVRLFLRAHGARPDWLYPALFNARKGILNTVLPARSGTLVLLHSLTSQYSIKWHHYLYFSLLASAASLYISVLALVWIMWPLSYSIALLLTSLGLSLFIARFATFRYAACLPVLLLIALGIFVATVAVFFCLLRGLGYSLSVLEISYFAVTLNALAQVSITPGNIGVREIVMAITAPYVALPVSVGIIASSILLVLRLAVSGVIWGVLEWLLRRAERTDQSTTRT